MSLREIILIDESKCDGCGLCAQGCPEGALKVVEGKARLVGESLCDGLGACIGECPRGAITVEKREAEAYDEARVMEGMARQGDAVIAAHLDHLAHHGQDLFERQALEWLAARGKKDPRAAAQAQDHGATAHHGGGCASGGCPGSASRRFAPRAAEVDAVRSMVSAARSGGPETGGASPEGTLAMAPASAASALSHWPIQLKLVNPRAPQYAGARLLIAADCTAFSIGAFHAGFLAGRSLVIACPKLDEREGYVEKLAALIGAASSVEIAIMEVPCCGGLLKLAQDARAAAGSALPLDVTVIGIEGGIKGRRRV